MVSVIDEQWHNCMLVYRCSNGSVCWAINLDFHCGFLWASYPKTINGPKYLKQRLQLARILILIYVVWVPFLLKSYYWQNWQFTYFCGCVQVVDKLQSGSKSKRDGWMMELPRTGLGGVIEKMKEEKRNDVVWQGKCSGTVYVYTVHRKKLNSSTFGYAWVAKFICSHVNGFLQLHWRKWIRRAFYFDKWGVFHVSEIHTIFSHIL